jgi:nucleotide-binding universal stress UspA family protein
MLNIDKIRSIFHPTDFNKNNTIAIAHAIRLSNILNLPLNILYVGRLEKAECRKILYNYLIKWELCTEKESITEAFKRLKIKILIVDKMEGSLPDIVLNKLKTISDVLLVMATAGREGLPRWLHPSRAEEIARQSKLPTVFVPEKSKKQYLASESGYGYKKILVPIDHKPNPQVGIHFAHQLVGLSDAVAQIIIFHAGEIMDIPQVEIPKAEKCIWRKLHEPGDPVTNVIKTAEEFDVDLIIMATAGHKGFMDALLGSVTEKVIRHALCPVIAVPVQNP